MNIGHFIHAAVATAMTLLVVSCANDDLLDGRSNQFPAGREVTINFSYSVQSITSGGTPDPQTRTVPDDLDIIDGVSLPIENMFVIQFNGNTLSSTMVGAPRFLDKVDLTASPLSAPLIQNSNTCYTLFVANIPEGSNYNWNLSTQSTLSDAVKRIKTITAENEVYVTVGSVKTLLASALVESVVEAGTMLTPVFTRSVAKLTLNLKLSNSEMEIKSVRLRNVSTGLVYADAALDEIGVSSSDIYPEDVITMDYDAVTSDMPVSGSTKTLNWYVPRNQRGINSSSVAAVDKTFYAPDHATYFEIVAVKTVAGVKTTGMFHIYPGADEISDFNITANNHYTIDLEVKDIGDGALDSRVETFKNVSYVDNGGPGSRSNSFIINPAPAGGGNRYYDIPIDQVNRYWGSAADGFGNTPANVIGNDDLWTVTLIWSDLTGLFNKVYNASGTAICLENNNTFGEGKGKGPGQFFRLLVPAGLPEGNFTLGIKKDGSQYLWSWHFWVTGYNPNKFNKSLISDGVYTYSVPGGQVERYHDSASGTSYWNTGVYQNTVMMDRALGMVSDNLRKQLVNASRGNLHYQFGRKDPFPTSTPLVETSVSPSAGPVVVKTTMGTPATFYTVASGNWANEANTVSYTWNDPAPHNSKSIYDPCPPGWHLPVNGTWNDFNRQVSSAYINTLNVQRDLGYGYGRGIGSVSSNVNGLRYWPGVTATDPVGGTIWFPAAGLRGNNTGTLGSVGSAGYYWSSSAYSTTSGYLLYFYSTRVNPSNGSNRALGFSVRCIAD